MENKGKLLLLIVHKFFLMMLARKIIVFKPTLQTTNQFFFLYNIESTEPAYDRSPLHTNRACYSEFKDRDFFK